MSTNHDPRTLGRPLFLRFLHTSAGKAVPEVNGVDGGLKYQIQDFGFQDSKRAEQARMEGMRRRLLTRQRVMRLECQLPKGKELAAVP